MKRTCQYCDSPLLDTDDVCWHCGRPQPSRRPAETALSTRVPDNEEEIEQELEPVGHVRTALYAGLTCIVIITLLLVMRSLGRSPVMVSGVDVPEGNWVYVRAPDNAFAIELPATWQWHFLGEESDLSEVSEALTTEERVAIAARPLSDLVPDITYVMIAEAEERLLVVARSARLNRLTPQQVAAALPSEQFTGLTILNADAGSGDNGESRTRISLIHDNRPLRCEQHLVPGPIQAYLLAVCTTEDDYRGQQQVFNYMLDRFSSPAH